MIGQQVSAWRRKQGLSQEAAAALAGVPRKQLWKLENDKVVTIETFRRVVTALEIPAVTFGTTEVLSRDVDLETVRAEIATAIASLQQLARLLDVMPVAPKRTAAPTLPHVEPLSNTLFTPLAASDDPILQKLVETVEKAQQQARKEG